MSTPILTTKLFIPTLRTTYIERPRLTKRLEEGLNGQLTLLSAPAGFGKTSLVASWVRQRQETGNLSAAWLSIDPADNDPPRFIAYFVAALQRYEPSVGQNELSLMQAPQPLPLESILTSLINQLAALHKALILVLDDAHLLKNRVIWEGLTFFCEHLPPNIHLIMTTRSDPPLPLARIRARGALTEIGQNALRFSNQEAAGFLNRSMGLSLSPDEIALLESRTEGWITGLQLAALSLQHESDSKRFIESFSGSHRFVLDYLMEEVLGQQPADVQYFLLHTSILDRLHASLCESILPELNSSGQNILETLEQNNLFVVPLDNERDWFRYHHLFAELLQRLLKNSLDQKGETLHLELLHKRASDWFATHHYPLDAFRHAAAAGEIERAISLAEGNGSPLYFKGTVAPIIDWIETLPDKQLDNIPKLAVLYGTCLTLGGYSLNRINPLLKRAEIALHQVEPEDMIDLRGRIAALRAMLAIVHNDIDQIMGQAQLAEQLLDPNNLPFRCSVYMSLGYAHLIKQDIAAGRKAYTLLIESARATDNFTLELAGLIGLGNAQELSLQHREAYTNYQLVVERCSASSLAVASAAYIGLAQVAYEWGELEDAQRYAELAVEIGRPLVNVDIPVMAALVMAKVRRAYADYDGAGEALSNALEIAESNRFQHTLPEITKARVLNLLDRDRLEAARELIHSLNDHTLLARLYFVSGEIEAAKNHLMIAQEKEIEAVAPIVQLKTTLFEAVVNHRFKQETAAYAQISEALRAAEPGGLIQPFLDEGEPMRHLLIYTLQKSETDLRLERKVIDFGNLILSRFKSPSVNQNHERQISKGNQGLIEPLSERELEVLHLIAEGYSNREIGDRLYLSLNTIKGHNRRIFGKLQVQRRTEAVAKARELDLL